MNPELKTCCARCKGAFQICRRNRCDCHIREVERNLDHDTRSHPDPTADAALANLAFTPYGR